MEIKIEGTNKILGDGSVFIVAEIGKNFIQTEKDQSINTYFDNAKKLIQAAKDAGADAVKFQTHNVEDEQYPITYNSPHFAGADRYSWVKRNTEKTPASFWRKLKAFCDDTGVVFFSTPMSRGAAIILEEIGTPFWKVASGDITDFVLLDFIVSTKKPIIIPTGMIELSELDKTSDFLRKKKIPCVILHAISRYPYPAEDSNLGTIEFYKERYPNVLVGFSQNSPWIEPAVIAVAMGISVLEQHFTFDRTLWGPDHKVSMTPEEFTEMVRRIRKVEEDTIYKKEVLKEKSKYYGKKEKILQDGETKFIPLFRKALMAGQDIPSGTVLTSDMIYAMRPRSLLKGLPAHEFYNVVGKKVKKDLKKYDPITNDIFV